MQYEEDILTNILYFLLKIEDISDKDLQELKALCDIHHPVIPVFRSGPDYILLSLRECSFLVRANSTSTLLHEDSRYRLHLLIHFFSFFLYIPIIVSPHYNRNGLILIPTVVLLSHHISGLRFLSQIIRPWDCLLSLVVSIGGLISLIPLAYIYMQTVLARTKAFSDNFTYPHLHKLQFFRSEVF